MQEDSEENSNLYFQINKILTKYERLELKGEKKVYS
jgi:hypothetical protein